MSLTAVTTPPPGGRPGPPRLRIGPGLVASLLLHAGLAVWLLWLGQRVPPQPPAEAEGVPVVFESASGEAGPPLPQPEAPAGAPEEAGGALAPLAPPELSAPPSPSQPPPPPPPAAPNLAEAPPAPPPPAPPPPVPAPTPAPAPLEPPPPPRAQPEAPPAPPPAPRVAEAPPTPLPAPPPPPPLPDLSAELAPPTPLRLRPPPPRPPVPQTPEAPRAPSNPFAGATRLGPEALRPIAPPPQSRPAPARPGQLDMAIGPVPQRSLAPGQPAYGGSASMAHVSGARPGQSWGRAFQAWVQSRGFYPPQAAAAGEDGPVVMRVTVARDGRIEAVQITGRSGSRWLDAAAISLFRDQVGPAFTGEMEGDSTTLTFTVNYRIIYR